MARQRRWAGTYEKRRGVSVARLARGVSGPAPPPPSLPDAPAHLHDDEPVSPLRLPIDVGVIETVQDSGLGFGGGASSEGMAPHELAQFSGADRADGESRAHSFASQANAASNGPAIAGPWWSRPWAGFLAVVAFSATVWVLIWHAAAALLGR